MHSNYRKGFTLVEILIVIVVIAILATITAVSYNGIQERAIESGAHSNLKDARNILITHYIDNGQYPAMVRVSENISYYNNVDHAACSQAGDTNGANPCIPTDRRPAVIYEPGSNLKSFKLSYGIGKNLYSIDNEGNHTKDECIPSGTAAGTATEYHCPGGFGYTQ